MNEQPKDLKPVAPGTVVTPGSTTPEAVAMPDASTPAVQPTPIPEPAQQMPAPPPPVTPQAPAPEPQPQAPIEQPPTEPEQPVYQANPSTSDDPDSISWTASEFVAHDKSSDWYVLLGLGTVAATGLMYVLTKDLISAAVVVLASIIFAVYGAHKPRQLEYRVDIRAVTIGGKTYGYDQFRSFSVIPEGAFSSIVFMPLKRFAVPITIYYAPQDEDKIVELLSVQLPYEQRRRDAVDSLMRKVRF